AATHRRTSRHTRGKYACGRVHRLGVCQHDDFVEASSRYGIEPLTDQILGSRVDIGDLPGRISGDDGFADGAQSRLQTLPFFREVALGPPAGFEAFDVADEVHRHAIIAVDERHG